MAEDSQKNLTYNQSQERLLDQTWAAMRDDSRLQGMVEGMVQSMLSMPDNLERTEIIRGLAQSLAGEGTRLRLEQQPDSGPQPSQLNDDYLGALRSQAESLIELRVEYESHGDQCRWKESAWTPADKGLDPVQQIKSRLQSEQAAAKEPEQDKVSALVQVTHTTGRQHDSQKLQARQQVTRQAQSLDQAKGR